MKAVIQRVNTAQVTIDHGETRKIGPGLVIFLGVMTGDTTAQVDFLCEKIRRLRIFEDADGRMNRSVCDVGGSLLVISNFTLGADCKKGNRPSFINAAPPELANPLYEAFVSQLRASGDLPVQTGSFGAHMEVLVSNDGPVTIILDTQAIGK